MLYYYADDSERVRLIAGFRALATFLEDQPDVPAPRWVSVLVFPPDGADSLEFRSFLAGGLSV